MASRVFVVSCVLALLVGGAVGDGLSSPLPPDQSLESGEPLEPRQLESELPPLCVVCKCVAAPQDQANKPQYSVHCKDASATVELSRSKSWPAGVRRLSVTHAALRGVPQLPSSHPLDSLSLSHNALEELPPAAFQGLGLRELNLGHNGLRELDGETLRGAEQLVSLHLQHNSLENISWTELEPLSGLQELYLQDNYLKNLEGAANLTQLKVLNMSGNSLTELPQDTCAGLAGLEVLLLADNQFTVVPSCILHLKDLQELVLDGNPIEEVSDGAFYMLSSLRALSLSRMPEMHEVNGAALRGLGQLTTLRMSHNPRLEVVHRTLLVGEEAAQHDWKIAYVDLSYNSLSSLPHDLAPWDMLGSLNLQGNPWDCACTAQWMVDKLVPAIYAKNSALLEEARCASPPSRKDRRLVHWLDRESKKGVWCENEDSPAPLTQVTVLQSGSSHGMLIALSALAGVALILLVVGFVLQRRFDSRRRQERKDMATRMGRCRNPRNGSVRLTHPQLGI